jgi:O-antigen/teichoic acid export membrane protein
MTAGYFAMPALLHAQNGAVVTVARWYLLIAPIWALQGMFPPSVRGVGDFAIWNLMRVMVSVCTIFVLAIAWFSNEANPRFIALGNLTFNALLFAPFFWLVQQRIQGSYSPERTRIRPLLQYGLPCAITGLPQMFNLRLDQMVMAAMVPPRDLGLYVVAVAWSSAVSPVLTSIGAAILPAVASAHSREDAIRCLGQGVRTACGLAALLCTALLAITPVAIVFCFGSMYDSAIPAAVVLLPAAGVLGVNFTLQESIRGLGFPYAVLRAELFGLAVTGFVLAFTLRPLGILGAAVSSLLGYSAIMAALVASAKRLTGTSAKDLLVPSRSDFKIGLRRVSLMARSLVAV